MKTTVAGSVEKQLWSVLSSAPASSAAVAAISLAMYVGLEWISFIHVHKDVPITPWDPGLGVVFALMVRKTPLAGGILFVGVIVAEIVVVKSDAGWPIIIGIGTITALSFASVVTTLRRRFQISADLVHLRDVLLLLAAGLAGSVIDTILLTLFLL